MSEEIKARLSRIEKHLGMNLGAMKLYRSGEWVPEYGQRYWVMNRCGCMNKHKWHGNMFDKGCLEIGNVFPTEDICNDAMKHRAFYFALDSKAVGSPRFFRDNDGKFWVNNGEYWLGEEFISRFGGIESVQYFLTSRVFRFSWLDNTAVTP